MIPKNRLSTHPGKILLQEFLNPMELTQKGLADYLDIPIQRINEIVKGKRGVTPGTAWLLSKALDTTPEFWMNLQSLYDLSKTRPNKNIKPLNTVNT